MTRFLYEFEYIEGIKLEFDTYNNGNTAIRVVFPKGKRYKHAFIQHLTEDNPPFKLDKGFIFVSHREEMHRFLVQNGLIYPSKIERMLSGSVTHTYYELSTLGKTLQQDYNYEDNCYDQTDKDEGSSGLHDYSIVLPIGADTITKVLTSLGIPDVKEIHDTLHAYGFSEILLEALTIEKESLVSEAIKTAFLTYDPVNDLIHEVVTEQLNRQMKGYS